MCFFAALLSAVVYLHFKFGYVSAPDMKHRRS